MLDLRIRYSLGQLQEAVSKSMAHTSRYVAQKIRSGVDGAMSVNAKGILPQRAATPLKFPQLNETYPLMDVDYLRPQGARPWGSSHSLQVMNPDPDYLDEEYVQVGPQPTAFDESCPARLASDPQPSDNVDEEQGTLALLSQLPADDTTCHPVEYSGPPSLEDAEIDPDGGNFASACLSSVDARNWEQQNTSPFPGLPQPIFCLPCRSKDTGELLLCGDIQGRPEDAALLAGMIRAGLATQRCRIRRL